MENLLGEPIREILAALPARSVIVLLDPPEGRLTVPMRYLEREIEAMNLRTYHLALDLSTERKLYYLDKNKLDHVLVPATGTAFGRDDRIEELTAELRGRGGEPLAVSDSGLTTLWTVPHPTPTAEETAPAR